ncbi:molybdenum cofactor guanylyltransferase [Campylobacter sp. MIT 21-1685]|uniref:molybdenum cofactor guanylyltransferase n=1 Tax=unclassified Campylobacter TaxID=2593542 RepID=UPI00224AA37A|nr:MULTISPECIES: molybdenum cofactor guanylyltransferase [unclassified Campylobacter]MCX2683511.1 molybdenum cofactor guanylyltransferase [Campylobacter sp. MIT 21-1684]MCX2751792.1 molybdenum cofactor guanylyltransferase [Campylobacter sp. MIT 21-1682]MCX2807993.1 molybdenum cofactor guanylyltransferase [Campylobacter sp. MIT 21-1685]
MQAVILCGGRSLRMGEDKCKLLVGSSTLLEFQAQKLSQIFDKVFISAKEQKLKGYELIKDDEKYQFYSPMLALYSILKHFDNEFVFVLSVDSPKVSVKEIQKLLHFKDKESKIIIAKTQLHIHFLCGLYHSSLALLCQKCLENDEHKLQNLCTKTTTRYVEFDDESPFLNLNFYTQYQHFLRIKC